MAMQLITYALRDPGADVASLQEAIKAIGVTWWQCLECVWLIDTTLSSSTIRDRLQAHLSAGDQLLVVTVGGSLATTGVTRERHNWSSCAAG